MIKRLCAVLLIILTWLTSAAAAASPTQDDLEALADDLLAWKEQEDIDFYRDWTPDTLNTFRTLAAGHGFALEDGDGNALLLGSSIFNTLTDCECQAFGEDRRFWTLEQQYLAGQLDVSLGIESSSTTALPGEGALTQEEAVALARQAILAGADGDSGYTAEDFEDCERVSVAYHDYSAYPFDDPKQWRICFYEHIDELNWHFSYGIDYSRYEGWVDVFTVTIYEGRLATKVSYDDPHAMQPHLYDAHWAHDGAPLYAWPLEDKQQLYDTLLPLRERELARRGQLPENDYVQVLEHVQGLPQDGERTQGEALELAKALLLAQGVSEDALVCPGVFFWRDEGREAQYRVGFYGPGNALLHAVDVPVTPGEAAQRVLPETPQDASAIGDSSLSREQAVRIAREELLAEAGSLWTGGPGSRYYSLYTVEDVEACTMTDVTTVGGRPTVRFYLPESELTRWPGYSRSEGWFRAFEVVIHDGGAIVQITVHGDPYAMAEVLSDARAAHGGRPLRFWSLENKRLLYETLSGLYEREMLRREALPEDEDVQILAHVQSLPREDELTEEEAVLAAIAQLAAQGVSEEALRAAHAAVYLWRDAGEAARYHVEFYTGEAEAVALGEYALLGSIDFDAKTP